jgi:hypothetical protein
MVNCVAAGQSAVAIARHDHQTDALPCRDDLIVGLEIDVSV